ncbi:MAG: M15 family metallopeptidase [Capsulimonas sp.]|uniref:M15 family metallopeptidase n=1 Tax=Capsulimonas sp. TaxID=2494211 RepID=UPI0032638530
MTETASRYPKPITVHSFDVRFDRRSFGEPLSRLRAIPIIDSGEPLVDLRDACPDVVLRPGCLPFLRKTVAEMVNQVQAALPPGHKLAVGTGLRTWEMQTEIRVNVEKSMREKHPDWSAASLQRNVNRMVAPLEFKSPPPHTTGAALDVGVLKPDGESMDFTASEDFWATAPTYLHTLPEHIRDNRRMLIHAMESAGLTNYVGEWWHWSYGDQGWALRVGSPTACYGSVVLEDAESKRIPEEEKTDAKTVAEQNSD